MKKGWRTATLAEVCDFRGGGTPSKSVARYWRGEIPWVSPKDMKSDVVSDSIDHISPEALKNSATSLIPDGAVLMVVRSGILARIVPLAVTGRPLTINQDLKALCPRHMIGSRFLFYLLQSKMDELLSLVSTGATVHRLMSEQVRSIAFALPPLPEQARIVRVLDEAFEGLAAAQANAEKNLQHAEAFFRSGLQTVVERVSARAPRLPLGVATSKIGSGATPLGGENAYKPTGTSLIRSLNVYDLGFRFEGLAHIDDLQAERLGNVVVQPGDVLLNITGASIARCCVVPSEVLPARVNQHVAIIRALPGKVRSRYLHYLLISPQYKGLLLQTGEEGGSTRQAITKAQLQDFVIAVPDSLKEQDLVVDEIDELARASAHLKSNYTHKLAALAALKQSLLHQAFTGQL